MKAVSIMNPNAALRPRLPAAAASAKPVRFGIVPVKPAINKARTAARATPYAQHHEPPPATHTLLSLDGGGIRGILQVYIMRELEAVIAEVFEENGTPLATVDLADHFDCISGTSVGAILALYFADKGRHVTGLPPGHGAELARVAFESDSKYIFPKPMWPMSLVPRGVTKSVYDPSGIENFLEKLFGDGRLTGLHTSVVVPSFEVDDGGMFLFWAKCNSFGIKTGYSTMVRQQSETVNGQVRPDMGGLAAFAGTDFNLKSVARASSAAPTFFPAAKVCAASSGKKQSRAAPAPDKFGTRTFVDGGMVANNPSMQAVSWMADNLEGCIPGSVAVISLGTGNVVVDATSSAAGGGFLQWAPNLLSVIQGSAAEAGDVLIAKIYDQIFNCEPGRYLRIQETVTEKDQAEDGITAKEMMEALSSLDGVDKLPLLGVMGKRMATCYRPQMKEFAKNYLLTRWLSRRPPSGEERRAAEPAMV